jgi:hypothetical protein
MSELFLPSLQTPVVNVTAAEDQTRFAISWPAVPAAVGYYVYAGFDPLHIRSRVSGVSAIPVGTTTFSFSAAFAPPSQIIYFWVSWIDANNNETFLDQVGSYHYLSAQMGHFVPSPHSAESTDLYFASSEDDEKYYFEEIRRRAKAVLEDTSEEVDLFIRQWRGLPEPGTQSALGTDPNYQGMTRDDNSFGTGFYPGYCRTRCWTSRRPVFARCSRTRRGRSGIRSCTRTT